MFKKYSDASQTQVVDHRRWNTNTDNKTTITSDTEDICSKKRSDNKCTTTRHTHSTHWPEKAVLPSGMQQDTACKAGTIIAPMIRTRLTTTTAKA